MWIWSSPVVLNMISTMGKESLHGCMQTLTEPLLCILKITVRKKEMWD